MPKRSPLNLELSQTDRQQLQAIADHWDCSLAETVRRLTRTAHKHIINQEFVCPDSRPCSCPHLVPLRPTADPPIPGA